MSEITQQMPDSLVLASGSPYRARLLARLGLPFEARAPGVDERPKPAESPEDLALRLAVCKARAATVPGHANELIIGSDQVAICDGQFLGKPGNQRKAMEQLAFCSNKVVTFYTSVALFHPGENWLASELVRFEVGMRALEAPEIERYVHRDDPIDCAGSFKWEALGISLFDYLRGDDPTALEGLPLIALCRLLRRRGYLLP